MPQEPPRLASLEEGKRGSAHPLQRFTASNLRLRNGLELPDHPAVGSGRHQHDVVHHDMFVMDSFPAVGDSQFVLRSIVQFHDVTLGRIKYRLQVMRLIRVLASQTGALLAGHRIAQHFFNLAGEWPFERIEGIEFERPGHAAELIGTQRRGHRCLEIPTTQARDRRGQDLHRPRQPPAGALLPGRHH